MTSERQPSQTSFPWKPLLLLAGITLAVYWPSFQGVFLFDDFREIVENPHLQSLAWPWSFLHNVRRPFLYLTLALNHAVSGPNVFGYHLVNLAIHMTAGATLFFLVRRVCRRFVSAPVIREGAGFVAFGAALLWLVHPLQTQAVTYIIQRAESLMGCLFLIALYAAVRYFEQPSKGWLVTVVVSGLLSGLTKEVAVMLPVVVALFDRCYVSGAWRVAWQRHYRLYAGFSVIWAVMLVLALTARPEESPTAGFGYPGSTPGYYAVNQLPVILHYIRMAFWPYPVVFDYAWPATSDPGVLWPAGAVVLSIVALGLALVRRAPRLGFPLLAFFLILLPSSSIIPLKDLIFVHRMYLPLVFLLVLTTAGVWWLSGRVAKDPRRQRTVFGVILLVAAGVLGAISWRHNRVFRSPVTLWADVVAKQSLNARAHNNLGKAYFEQGEVDRAVALYARALALDPFYADAYVNMGTAKGHRGELDAAIAYTRRAIALNPEYAIAYNNLGASLMGQRAYADAVPQLEKAVALGFRRYGVYRNLGIAYAQSGRPHRALAALEQAAAFKPGGGDVQDLMRQIRDKLAAEEAADYGK